MEIRLTDEYRLITDPLNYILQKRNIIQNKESKNYGQETWVSISWHGKLEHLISKLIDLEIKQSNVTQLEELVTVINNVRDQIIDNLKDYEP